MPAISHVRTVRLGEFPNLLLVEIGADDGGAGWGETFFGARAAEAYVHESAAPLLLGRDAETPSANSCALHQFIGFGGTGAETRGRSALDLALWDLTARQLDVPVHQLLGGRRRESVEAYNTCAGYQYTRGPLRLVDNWGLPTSGDSVGPYEDLQRFLNDPGGLARDLVAEGYTGMKVWPYDPLARKTHGHHVSSADLARERERFDEVRAAVGSDIDILIDFHSMWDAASAKRVAGSLAGLDIYWFEDLLDPANPQALADVRDHVPGLLAGGETIGSLDGFRNLVEQRALDVLILDLGWVGGLTTATRVDALASAFGVPTAVHDCTGPLALTAATHFAVAMPSATRQEVVRAFHSTWYRELITDVPPLHEGRIRPPDGPGWGTTVRPAVLERADATIRTTSIDS